MLIRLTLFGKGVNRNSDLIHTYGGVGPVIGRTLYEMIFDAVGG